MELRTKKRIVGFLLLIALGLILVPLFFGRSITSDELTLSSHVPNRPEKPSDITLSIPDKETTIAEVPAEPLPQSTESKPKQPKPQQSKPEPTSASTPSSSRIVFEQVSPEMVEPVSLPESPPAVISTPTPAVKPAPIPSAVTPTPKKMEIAPKPGSWVVQMGSFSDKKNAETLMKKIQAAGFPAYLETSKNSKGNAVRVLVGPELQKSTANAMQAKLAKSLNITGIVVKATR